MPAKTPIFLRGPSCLRDIVLRQSPLLLLALTACTPHLPTPRPPIPLQFHLDTATIELSAPAEGVLCLHLATTDHPHAPQSIFLDPTATPIAPSQLHEGDWQGIRSPTGDLLINPITHQWTLRSQNKILIPASPLPTQNTLSLRHNQIPHLYASGDNPNLQNKSLLHTDSFPKLGNGHATLPYYFATAGYAALATSDDDNSPPAYTTATTTITWIFPPNNSATLYLMPATDLKQAAKSLAALTGHAPVPPRWTVGYLQSRWGWKDKAYIDDTAKHFADAHLPIDAFIFDFEWYTPTPDYSVQAAGLPDFQDFSFNPHLFPDPAKQIATLHAQGIHVVGIRKPRLGNSAALALARQNNWILSPGKSNIDTRVLNFALPEVQHYYATQMAPLLAKGIDAWWNDEGELAYTLYHHWNNAEQQSLDAVHPQLRPWSLNRAFSPGLQRTGAAAWTGDIHATWQDLQHTPATLLNWSLAGIPFTACDIGGFSGQTTPYLLSRWMQAGVFFPIMRAHSTLEDTPHFPWLFGDDAETNIAAALHLRYRLIPYLYSLAHEAHTTGLPMMRPIAMEYPNDPRCADLTDEWLLGNSLLAAPILTEQNERTVYLPAGDAWYPFNSSTPTAGNQTLHLTAAPTDIPFFLKAGTLLPLAPKNLEHTDNLPAGPLELQIYPGKDATFTLTEDDGVTTAYLHGQIRQTTFTWKDSTRTLTWKSSGPYHGNDCFTAATVTLIGSFTAQHILLGKSGSLALH